MPLSSPLFGRRADLNTPQNVSFLPTMMSSSTHVAPGTGTSGLFSSSPGINTTKTTPMMSSMAASVETLELAGRNVEKVMHADSQFPPLQDKLRIGGPPSLSGLQEPDYPSLNLTSGGVHTTSNLTMTGNLHGSPELASLRQLHTVKRVPLPAELVEHFGHMQCNCLMGLFPPIGRAWLTIDSDIYVWKFEDCSDLAYFDGLGDTILSVALLTPKKNIFQPHIKYLLCLTTAVEMILLGVSFSKLDDDDHGEMHLLPEPLFTLPTDATYMLTITSSANTGRIFLGGKDGCLYEFTYKAEDGWFGKKAAKINHSTNTLSFLVPGFVSAALYEEDALEQIVVDDTRNVLYTRSEKGVIQVFDLGQDGMQLNKVAAVTQASIVQEASRVAINIDKSNFAPIVGISTVPTSESVSLSLVAISGNGVRYYFSTSGRNLMDRPQNLTLQHIRLPPGFSASSPVPKPSRVHMGYYKQGTLLLASAQSEDSDLLWLLSSDSFPFQNILMEGQSTIPLDGRVWALDEIPQPERLLRLYKESFSSQNPPLVVVQHTQVPRRFVLLSAQGTHIVTKLRPVDHLRQLLIEHGGPDNDVIKAFFGLHSEVQAVSTCLVLACSQALQDTQVAEWATRAIFLYGGEPLLVFPHQQRPGVPQPGQPAQPFSPSFHPNIASTPAPGQMGTPGGPGSNMSLPYGRPDTTPGGPNATTAGQSMFSTTLVPEMHFSPKHNGLHLYFSRLVRPVWMATLVVPGCTDPKKLTSSVSGQEMDWIMSQLNDLKTFMEKNSQFSTNPTANMSTVQHQSQQEALLRERQSLLFLQQLVSHTIQVLGLWQIVCDHQFHIVAATLARDDQNMLAGMYFRDLIMSHPGKDLSSRLVQAVINRYLDDNASTDAISNRLRMVCPSLYNNEDAISSKAHEIMIQAKTQPNMRERQKMLDEAVQMCKGIAGRINLEVLTSHLTSVHCYTGAVEICLAAAQKRDPQGLALHYYKNGEPMEDQQGLQAFMARMSCYKYILEILRKLLDTSISHPMSPSVPKQPGPPPPPDPNSLPPSEASEYAEMVIQGGLRSEDHLFHVALYQWLIDNGQFDKLLGIRSSFLEDFLTRGTRKHPDTIVMFDLLWKYYEKTRSYAAAAKILSKLADRHSTEVSLEQRLQYLSRAIVFVKSGELGGESSRVGVGELLHDLEEKMEVARVQLQILNSLVSKRSANPEIQNALAKLNAELLDISQLYQDFAEPYQLWESQLGILHCAGHHEPKLVENLWENIIEEELNNGAALPVSSRIVMVSNKIKSLGKMYATSQKYFPLEFIIRKLELFSCEVNADHGWVFNSFLAVNVSLPKLLEVYNKLFSSHEPIWLTKGQPNHLLHVLAKILETFADSPTKVPSNERRQFTVVCLDAVGHYLGNLYTKHDSQALVQEFRGIQAKLERL